MRYYIKSNKTGKYLSNLFEDTHEKMFRQGELRVTKYHTNCYFYRVKQVALDIAKQLNGQIVEIDEP